MSAQEFMFAVRLAEKRPFEDMLQDLANSVLQHSGYDAAAIAAILRELGGGIEQARAGGACDVEFHARGGTLEIAITQNGRPVFRASRPLP